MAVKSGIEADRRLVFFSNVLVIIELITKNNRAFKNFFYIIKRGTSPANVSRNNP